MSKPITGTGYGTDKDGRIVYYEKGKIKPMGTEAWRFLKRGVSGVMRAGNVALDPYRRHLATKLSIAQSASKRFQKAKQDIGDRLVYEPGTTQTIRQRKLAEKRAKALMIADENAVLKAQVEMDAMNKKSLKQYRDQEKLKVVQQLKTQIAENNLKGEDTTDDKIVADSIIKDRDYVSSGLSQEEVAELQAQANKDRAAGKLSDIRGGGGNIEELKIKSDVHTIDPKTGKAVGVLTRNQRKVFEARADVRKSLLEAQKNKNDLRIYKNRTAGG